MKGISLLPSLPLSLRYVIKWESGLCLFLSFIFFWGFSSLLLLPLPSERVEVPLCLSVLGKGWTRRRLGVLWDALRGVKASVKGLSRYSRVSCKQWFSFSHLRNYCVVHPKDVKFFPLHLCAVFILAIFACSFVTVSSCIDFASTRLGGPFSISVLIWRYNVPAWFGSWYIFRTSDFVICFWAAWWVRLPWFSTIWGYVYDWLGVLGCDGLALDCGNMGRGVPQSCGCCRGWKWAICLNKMGLLESVVHRNFPNRDCRQRLRKSESIQHKMDSRQSVFLRAVVVQARE